MWLTVCPTSSLAVKNEKLHNVNSNAKLQQYNSDLFVTSAKVIGVARIFSGVHFFPQKS